MNPKNKKILRAAIIIVLLGGAAAAAWHQMKDAGPVATQNPDCTTQSASVTSPAAYFIENLEAGTIKHIGGHPIEGFEPSMFLGAYPKLQPSDFDCVQTFRGMYRFQNGQLSLAVEGDPGIWTSADQGITPMGMAMLLENVGRRLGMPIALHADIDAIFSTIGIEPVALETEASYSSEKAKNEITITSPAAGASIQLPLVVEGKAKAGWFATKGRTIPEGAMTVALRDAQGMEVAQPSTVEKTGPADSEGFIPFKGTITLGEHTLSASGHVFVYHANVPEFQEYAKVPVRFEN